MKHLHPAWLILVALLLLSLPAEGQIQMPRSVVGGGGGGSGGASNSVVGTMGQTVIGIVSGPSHWHHIGFWGGPPTPTDADDTAGLPTIYWLGQNHPNPFNPKTTIRYAVPDPGRVKIVLYDIRGRAVRRLLDEDHEAGFYKLDLDADDLSSGVYFYRMQAGSYIETKKLVLMK